MPQSVLLLGRQPALGLAELESLFGADKLTLLGSQAVILDVPPQDVDFKRLGGSMRLATFIGYQETTEIRNLEKYLVTELPKHTCCLPEGKVRLGLSLYGFNIHPRQINALGLTLKKAVKNGGRSVRVVPNNEPELNTAQVLHNQLTGPTGVEMLLIKVGNRTALAQTVAVQDINAYAARDQARPARDARVGMLPPKLAQIIVNLATGDTAPSTNVSILDPFCGTGVVLQEALLMGYQADGTDLEPRMIDYSRKNLDWLKEQFPSIDQYNLEAGDATVHHWTPIAQIIAGETYLGRPFSAEPRPEILAEVMNDVDTIHRKFLRNVASQTQAGFRMTIAVPAWKTKSGFKHLRTLDSLEDLGYTRMSFVHVDKHDLLYYRENQLVARELVTLIRK